jgi:hypothetical protein
METEKKPRAILLVKEKTFYSTGIVEKNLPVRPENMEMIRNPELGPHEVWEFNEPDLYANGETAWFKNIAANLEGYYDKDNDIFVLNLVYWPWAPNGKVATL